MKKHIVCFGDSNTHGYCADPKDCADGGDRFNEEERWTCLLQKMLGNGYLVIEEGLSGRTAVFDDPITEGLSGISVITPLLMTHEPVDLLIVMLGTNDTKERFGCTPELIAAGIERLLDKARSTKCWRNGKRNILLVCPPAIGEEMEKSAVAGSMGKGCAAKAAELSKFLPQVAKQAKADYLDAAGCEFNHIDYMHLTKKGHRELAERIFKAVSGNV